MFGKAALLQHILELLLTPPTARLGGIAQAVAQPSCFNADLLLPFAQRLDQSAKLPESIYAVFLQLANLRLVARQPLANWIEQRLDPCLALVL